jgi:hypothetical protein
MSCGCGGNAAQSACGNLGVDRAQSLFPDGTATDTNGNTVALDDIYAQLAQVLRSSQLLASDSEIVFSAWTTPSR